MSERGCSAFVVAIGARTPVGRDALSTAVAVRAGVSRIASHPFMIDRTGEPFKVAMDSLLGSDNRLGRMRELALGALTEVFAQLPATLDGSIPVFLALPEPSRTFPREAADELCRSLTNRSVGQRRPSVTPMPEGNAGAVRALQRAIATINRDPSACCIVGGVDSFIDADVLEALDDAGRIASASTRWGFPPGEAAAMFAVCGPEFVRRHGVAVLAKVAGAATAREPNCMNTKTICLGVGLADAMRQAAEMAGGPITKQYCDLDGERYRENEFSYAVLRVNASSFVNSIDYVAPVDCVGQVGAAMGALLMLLPIALHRRGVDVGPRPMAWCGSENGLRGAVVFNLAAA